MAWPSGPSRARPCCEGFELAPGLAPVGLAGVAAFAVAAPAWRWIFYLSVPLAILAITYVWAAAPGWTMARARGRLDVLGAGLFTTALATGLLALTTLDQPARRRAQPRSGRCNSA